MLEIGEIVVWTWIVITFWIVFLVLLQACFKMKLKHNIEVDNKKKNIEEIIIPSIAISTIVIDITDSLVAPSMNNEQQQQRKYQRNYQRNYSSNV